MSIIHVQQIRAKLVSVFTNLIDLSDYEDKNVKDQDKHAKEKESAFLSRSLAAFTISAIGNLEPENAAKHVTDNYQDNGIDAIYFDDREKKLFLVQSKWHHDGRGSIDRGDCLKFINGVKDLIHLSFSKFNKKVNNLSKEITDALYDVDTRFVLLVSHTGHGSLGTDIQGDLDKFLSEMNDTSEIVEYKVLAQKQIHSLVVIGSTTPIDFDVTIKDWGQVREPYTSFYGRVEATEISAWMEKYYPRIFDPNIRSFLGKTDINSSISETLEKEPEKFWYFNNGITVLCDSIKKKPINGNSHDFGVFECTNVSIVNGAQTVGSIGSAYAKSPDALKDVTVMIRFISLEKCPDGFATRVTRATNTQNRVESRDFISLDPYQQELQTQLMLDGIEYNYKAGNTISNLNSGFEVVEAVVSLACFHSDLSYAVLAKDKISRLWEDVNKPPYKAIFNPSLSSIKLWKIVQIHRSIDNILNALKGADKAGTIPVHGNRFLARQVFRRLDLKNLDDPNSDIQDAVNKIPEMTTQLTGLVRQAISIQYPNSYPANLFRNREKCQNIESWLDSQLQITSI